jgi:hypothetical protein
MTAPDPFAAALDALVALVARRVVDEMRPLLFAAHAPVTSTALLDKRTLAHALTVSAATVSRMTADGMPHVFVGASPRYSLDEVRAWLAERGRQGTTAKPSKASIAGVRLLGKGGR